MSPGTVIAAEPFTALQAGPAKTESRHRLARLSSALRAVLVRTRRALEASKKVVTVDQTTGTADSQTFISLYAVVR